MIKSKEWLKKYKFWIMDDGTKCWLLNGEFHKEDGPAIEYADGSKFWYLNGKCHREDGPAVEFASGHKEWWLNGTEVKIRDFQRQKVYDSGNRYFDDNRKKFILNENLIFWEKYVKEILEKKWFYISKIDKIEVKINKKRNHLCVFFRGNRSIAIIHFPNPKFLIYNNESFVIHEIAHVLEENLHFYLISNSLGYIHHKMFALHGDVFCGCKLFLLGKIKGKKEEQLLKSYYDKNKVKYISNVSEIIKTFKESGKNSKKKLDKEFSLW